MRGRIRRVQYYSLDVIDCLLGRQDEMTPPRRMVANIGRGDFKATGMEFLRYFIELGEVRPNDRVLEVGCGVGRMAVALTRHLSREGCYEGLDIVPDTIAWCTRHISRKYPNVHFQMAAIYNKKYNPTGRSVASEYTFPYGDDSFDFVFLTSVFTHMLPQDVEKYLSEIRRVLKGGKKCLISFFLLNEESMKLIRAKVSRRDFQIEHEGYRIGDKDMAEREVAYEEEYIRRLYGKHELAILEPIRYGSWCGRPNHLSYQDIVVAMKTA